MSDGNVNKPDITSASWLQSHRGELRGYGVPDEVLTSPSYWSDLVVHSVDRPCIPWSPRLMSTDQAQRLLDVLRRDLDQHTSKCELIDDLVVLVHAAPNMWDARAVQARWKAWQVPDGDVILRADGTLSVMEYNPGFEGPPTWIETLWTTAWSPAGWLEIDSLNASVVYRGHRVLVGESSAHGSIGWVALTHADADSTLEWVAVSRLSNPFSEVAVDDHTVTAVSTAGTMWRFPRNAPHQVEITVDPNNIR